MIRLSLRLKSRMRREKERWLRISPSKTWLRIYLSPAPRERPFIYIFTWVFFYRNTSMLLVIMLFFFFIFFLVFLFVFFFRVVWTMIISLCPSVQNFSSSIEREGFFHSFFFFCHVNRRNNIFSSLTCLPRAPSTQKKKKDIAVALSFLKIKNIIC